MSAAGAATMPQQPDLLRGTGSAPRAPLRRPLVPMPDAVRRLFALFPLHEWPAASSVDAAADAVEKPTLFVSPPPPGAAVRASEWASANPVCLRWQMELLWRGADFDCQVVQGTSWGPGGQLPFLQLPKAGGTVYRPLLSQDALTQYVDTHYPLARLETGEKSVWPDPAAEAESAAWHNLLAGRVMAGTLLQCLEAGALQLKPSHSHKQPLLRSLLGSWLPGGPTQEQMALAELIELSSAGASSSALDQTFGMNHTGDVRNPLSHMPGFSVDFVGLLSGTPSQDAPDQGEPAPPAPGVVVDSEAITRQAADALNAVGTRLAETVDGDGNGWMLGASKPTSLDCLLFAALHTLLSLDAESSAPSDAPSPLRATIARHPVLEAYARRIWRTDVQPRGTLSA